VIDYNTLLVKEKILEEFKYVLPVFVTCQIVISNMEVKKFEGMKKAINWQVRGELVPECKGNE
jgi:hypothetical protein